MKLEEELDDVGRTHDLNHPAVPDDRYPPAIWSSIMPAISSTGVSSEAYTGSGAITSFTVSTRPNRSTLGPSLLKRDPAPRRGRWPAAAPPHSSARPSDPAHPQTSVGSVWASSPHRTAETPRAQVLHFIVELVFVIKYQNAHDSAGEIPMEFP